MRIIQIFVLRLLANPDEPRLVCGTLRAVTSGAERTFTSGPSLLAQLEQLLQLEQLPQGPAEKTEEPTLEPEKNNREEWRGDEN